MDRCRSQNVHSYVTPCDTRQQVFWSGRTAPGTGSREEVPWIRRRWSSSFSWYSCWEAVVGGTADAAA